jgi:hypothetical protein
MPNSDNPLIQLAEAQGWDVEHTDDECRVDFELYGDFVEPYGEPYGDGDLASCRISASGDVVETTIYNDTMRGVLWGDPNRMTLAEYIVRDLLTAAYTVSPDAYRAYCNEVPARGDKARVAAAKAELRAYRRQGGKES